MSKTIDERVVSMRFDNKDFEKNASETISTLDKLKKALSFNGAATGLNEVKNSMGGFNMNPLLEAVNNINDRFSTMGIIGMTALQNITNQAIQTGEQMLRSLTLDPINEGFQEYELKMGSVQTIMAGIGADFDDPEALAMVNDKLQELNTYADKTIYSFSDMTSSIGKFTNAGVDLDKAVAAIQGISNEAAVSGANAEQASHAMYNFAQALSSGSVKLIDWKSIENANMATVEFKEQLLQTAVAAGTVADNLDGTYTVLTENGQGKLMDDVISATSMFNDSLAYQWMTSDVLIDTLGRYADELDPLGQKAFAAAQDVKTFSQLMDTLKEAVGSGWATTWEIIFGDFNEAKQLWTDVSNVVGGFIDQQSTARNELLQGWKDLGGRVALIEALASAFEGLKTVIQPVIDAFRMVFPKTTAETLYSITIRIKELADQFRLSEEDATSLRNIFLGLFSVIQIIGNAIKAVISEFQPAGNIVIPILQNILKFLGDIGFYIYQHKDNISGLINSGIVTFIGAVLLAIQKLMPALNMLGEGIAQFSQNQILPRLEVIGNKLLEFLKTLPARLLVIFNEIIDIIVDCIKKIGAALMGFDEVETDSLDNFVASLKEKLKPLLVVFGAIGFIFSKLKDAVMFVYPYVAQYLPVIADIVGDFVKRIGKYISTMSASDLMDWINTGAYATFALSFRNIAKSFSGVGKMFEAATKAFKQLGGVLQDYQKNLKANILLKIAVAIGILAASLIALTFVEPGKLMTSVEAIGAMFVLLVAALKLITSSLKSDGIMEAIGQTALISALGTFMLQFSAAIAIMSGCILALSELGGDKLQTAMIGVAGIEALLGAMGILIAKLPKGKNSMVSLGIGLLMVANSVKKIAEAIVILIPPMETLGKMDRETLIQGGIAIAGMITMIGIAMALTSKVGIGSAVGLMAMTYTVQQMADFVVYFGDMDTTKLGQGLLALETVLGGIAILAGITGETKFGADEGIGLILMAASLEIIVDVMNKFAEMNMGTIAKGLGVMAGVLIELAVAMKIMDGAKVGAVALLLMAAAIRILVPALEAFGQLSIGEIVKGLIALGGILLVLAGATAIFSVLAPGMLLLSVALAALGVGLLAFSVALALIAAIDIAAIIALLPALGVAIMELCKMIESVTPTVMETVEFLIKQICKMIQNVAPTVFDTIFFLIETFLVQLAEHAPGMIESLFQILLALLNGLREHIREITEDIIIIVVEFIIGVINGIAEGMDRIIHVAYNLFLSFIEGLAAALSDEENTKRLKEAIVGLGKAIVKFFKDFFGINSPSKVFQDLGWNLIEGLIAGIGDMIKAAGDKILELGEHMLGIIGDKLDSFHKKGEEVVGNISEGIDNVKDNVKDAFHGWVDSLKDFKLDGFIDAGKNILNGLKQGIEDSQTFQNLKTATENVFGAVRDRIAKIFDENSPSKVTYGFGKYVVIGFANGIKAFSDTAISAADEFGEGALNSMKTAIANIADLVENGVDSEPTIRPVLDLSNVSSGIGRLDSMFDTQRSIDLASSASVGWDDMTERNQNGMIVNNNDVVQAISDLRNDFGSMLNAIKSLQLVMDTGALVGSISEPMDEAFGRMAVYNGRGI